MTSNTTNQDAKEPPINEYLIGLELKALSVLLDEWSQTGIKDEIKLQALRSAIMTGRGMGGKKKVEYEIVEDEYLVMYATVELFKETRNVETKIVHKVPLPGRRAMSFSRAFPCPPKELNGFRNSILSNRECGVITKELVEERLPACKKTIKKVVRAIKARRAGSETTVKEEAKRMVDRRFETSPEQRLLVSLFFDASSFQNKEEQSDIQKMLLDALLALEYQPIAIYYLVQTAHKLENPITTACNTAEEIKELCEFVAPNSQECFIDLANQ